jgi:hypothetical protein
VQVSDSSAALVSWEGSYWFDRGAGQGAARFLDFQVGGMPASAEQVADLIEPLSTEWADALRAYGPGTGGRIELGGGDPTCAPSDPPSDPGDGDPAAPPGDGDVDPTGLDTAPAPAGRALPSTGGTAPAGLAGLAVAAALAATWLLRALRPHRAPTAIP